MIINNRIKSILKYLGVAIGAALITFIITLVSFGGSELLLRFLIKAYYVEDIDQNVIDEGAKAGIVAALGDEHSVYIDSEYGFDHFENAISGEYSGIGAALQQINKKAVIVDIYPDSPAEKAGLKIGDIILEVSGLPSRGSTLTEVSQRLLGEPGTTVSIKIDRNGDEILFDITREEISVHTVTFEKLDSNIGYIKITSFDVDSDSELTDALSALSNSEKLIIDLRDNPGGYMDVVINAADLFIDEGTIVTAKYKSGENEYPASSINETELSDEFLLKTPMCVLVNENSASASEIFSAALKDYGRAKIVGTTTFGKGSIQSTFPLKNNSGVKLTVGHFYSPKGAKIDGNGVKPDIEVFLPEELKSVPVSDIPRADDVQLQSAIDALK